MKLVFHTGDVDPAWFTPKAPGRLVRTITGASSFIPDPLLPATGGCSPRPLLPGEVQPALYDLDRFMQSPGQLPRLVALALIHYQLEAIHPLMDGNGRVGRLLIVLLLLCAGASLSAPVIYPTAYFARHRQEYLNNLMRVSKQGARYEWITFFVDGMLEQADEASVLARRLATVREEYRRRIQATSSSARLLHLVDGLFATRVLMNKSVQSVLSLTSPAAQQNIDKAVEAGTVEEVTGRQRRRVYLCREIVALTDWPAG